MNLVDLAQQFCDEEKATAFLEKQRWPDGPVCPHCGLVGEAFRLKPTVKGKTHVRKGLWKCSGCRKEFSVKIGTIFEDSHIGLHKWLMAYHLICASKKGMSANQLHRMLGVTYKTAWFMAHRIRHTMTQKPTSKMTGTIEADETFIGGKRRTSMSHATKPGERPKDRLGPFADKAVVFTLMERDGRAHSTHVDKVTAANLKPVILEHISHDAVLNTDDNKVYSLAKKHFAGHDIVNHLKKEYARREADGRLVTTNTVEGFFSLIKRGVCGTFHHISRQHLHRYLTEFDFRWNLRDTTDGERTLLAVKGIEGKRLMYRDSCARA